MAGGLIRWNELLPREVRLCHDARKRLYLARKMNWSPAN